MKIDRRTTLQAMMASGMAIGLKPAAALAAANQPPSVLIYDGRFAACRAFAAAHGSARVLKIDSRESDLGIAWRERIAAHLQHHPGRVEGLSLYADHFISVGMGREHGLRLIADERVREDRIEMFRWSLA